MFVEKYIFGLPFSNPEQRKPPVFDVPLKPMTVNEAEKLNLRCHVHGSLPIKIQWMKDRKELTSSTNTRITFVDGTACLDISQTSKTDAGDYLCKATNDIGSEFCKCKVTVKGTIFMATYSSHLIDKHCSWVLDGGTMC